MADVFDSDEVKVRKIEIGDPEEELEELNEVVETEEVEDKTEISKVTSEKVDKRIDYGKLEEKDKEELIMEITEMISQGLKLDDIATVYGVSPRKLSKYLKEELGITYAELKRKVSKGSRVSSPRTTDPEKASEGTFLAHVISSVKTRTLEEVKEVYEIGNHIVEKYKDLARSYDMDLITFIDECVKFWLENYGEVTRLRRKVELQMNIIKKLIKLVLPKLSTRVALKYLLNDAIKIYMRDPKVGKELSKVLLKEYVNILKEVYMK